MAFQSTDITYQCKASGSIENDLHPSSLVLSIMPCTESWPPWITSQKPDFIPCKCVDKKYNQNEILKAWLHRIYS